MMPQMIDRGTVGRIFAFAASIGVLVGCLDPDGAPATDQSGSYLKNEWQTMSTLGSRDRGFSDDERINNRHADLQRNERNLRDPEPVSVLEQRNSYYRWEIEPPADPTDNFKIPTVIIIEEKRSITDDMTN